MRFDFRRACIIKTSIMGYGWMGVRSQVLVDIEISSYQIIIQFESMLVDMRVLLY